MEVEQYMGGMGGHSDEQRRAEAGREGGVRGELKKGGSCTLSVGRSLKLLVLGSGWAAWELLHCRRCSAANRLPCAKPPCCCCGGGMPCCCSGGCP